MDRTRTTLAELDRVVLEHLVADHGARYYGTFGSITFGRSDAIRYCVEGFVAKHPRLTDVTWDVLWDAVTAELDAHPEILAAGPVRDEALAERKAARQEAAMEHETMAREAFAAGDYPLAAAHVDAAERANPDGYGRDSQRALVATSHAAMLHDEAAGAAAYAAGEQRAPGVNPHVLSRIGDREVGDPRNRLAMEAFLRGYDRAADEAAAAALA